MGLLVTLIGTPAFADDFLSVQFSSKNQIRTGLTWIRHKPELVLAENTRKMKNNKRHPVNPVPDSQLNGRLPYSAIGKLLFTKDGGKVASCSASFVGGSDVIATAAHCVMTASGNWNADFLFIRGYGSDNHDVYAIECAALPAEWGALLGDDLLPFDYAFLRTSRKSPVGTLGITNGVPPGKLTIVGYSETHFEGRKLLQLPTNVVFTDSGKLASANNPFGEGNSGAPWINVSTVYSLSSHLRTDKKGTMWGPRLTAQAMRMIEFTRQGCKTS